MARELRGTLNRIMGGEKEYGAQVGGWNLFFRGPGNVWFCNGGRLYLDIGKHPEYNTRESTDPRKLAKLTISGDIEATERMQQLPTMGHQYLTANNIALADGVGGGIRIVGWGSHDNYLIKLPEHVRGREGIETYLNHLIRQITAFQISFYIIAGNGGFIPDGSGGYRRVLSERASIVDDLIGGHTTQNKVTFLLRDESLAGQGYYRLQVVGNDSNALFEPVWLRFALMDLMLLMAENDALGFMELELPLKALAAINADPWAEVSVRQSGESSGLTACQIQWAHLERAHEFVKTHGLEAKYQDALAVWEELLEAIERRDLEALQRRLGWALRWELATRYEEKLGRPMTGKQAIEFCMKTMLLFDSRLPRDAKGNFRSPLMETRRRMLDPAILEEAEAYRHQLPESGTRARLRALVIREAQQRRVPYYISSWTSITVEGITYQLTDPYLDRHQELEDWLQQEDDQVA